MFTLSGLDSPELFLVYGTAALTALVCLGVIIRAIFIPVDTRRACCCGACGHTILDTTPGRCTECGGLFTKVGLSTPSMVVRLAGGLAWALLAWTVLGLMASGLALGALQRAAWSGMSSVAMTLSTAQQMTETLNLAPFTSGVGSSADAKNAPLDYRIDASLTYTTGGPSGAVESPSATLALKRHGEKGAAILALDGDAKTFKLTDPDGKELAKGEPDALDDAVIRKWFVAAGIDPEVRGVSASMADALKVAKASVNDPEGIRPVLAANGSLTPSDAYGYLNYGGGSSSSTSPSGFAAMGGIMGPPAFWNTRSYLTFGVLTLIYLAGVAFIVQKRRRMLA